MLSKGEISVVVPTYNSEKYLHLALTSVSQQSMQPAEVIVVDDGSTDQSMDIARSYGATVLSTGVNSGPARARNLGWLHCQSEYVAFLDSDDEWEPDHISGLLRVMAETSADLISCVLPLNGVRLGIEMGAHSTLALADLVEHNSICQSGVMLRRDLFDIGLSYDETMRYAEDYELWLRLITASRKVLAYNASTVVRREHEGQASRATARMTIASLEVRLRTLRSVRNRGTSDAEIRGIVRALRLGLRNDLLDSAYAGDAESLRRLLARASAEGELSSEMVFGDLLLRLLPIYRLRSVLRRFRAGR